MTAVAEEEHAARPPPRPGVPRSEWIAVGLIVVLGAVLVGWWSRDAWFYSDFWDFLTLRDLDRPGDLLEPHNGNWQLPAVVVTRFIYRVAGMDFWPLHYLPRPLAWAGITVFAWWLLRGRRGADPMVALGFAALMTFLASSWYFEGPHLGAPIAISSILGAAHVIDTRPEPRNRDRVLVFSLLLVAVVSSGPGVTGMGAIGIGLVLTRKLRGWIVPVTAVAAIYAAWFLALGVEPSTSGPLRSGLAVLGGLVLNVENSIAELFGLAAWMGRPVLVLACAGLLVLAWRRSLTAFDVILLVWALLYLGLAARYRAGTARAAYGSNVLWMTLPIIVTRIRPTGRGLRRLGLALIVVLVLSNAVRLHSGIAERVASIATSRDVIESMAVLVDNGQAYGPHVSLRKASLSNYLRPEGLLRLIDEGWDPGVVSARDDAIVQLNAALLGSEAETSPAPVIVDGHYRRKDGCVSGLGGDGLSVRVVGSATVLARSSQATDLFVSWSARGTSATAELGRLRRAARPLYLYGPPPDGALITFAPADVVERIIVCGVVRADTAVVTRQLGG
jgi:hypothetical protein